MTQPNIPSMSRGQLIEYIEGMGAQYAADDTTPLHAAAAMVEQYSIKSDQVHKLSAELSKARRETVKAKSDLAAMNAETDRILSELKQSIEVKLSQ